MPENDRIHKHEHHHERDGARLTFRVLIPIVFLTAGLTLLALRIPGWSIIFGLPMIVFGTVFLVYTYDELVSRAVKPIPEKTLKCSVCGKPTPRLYPWGDSKDAVCYTCKLDAGRGKKKVKI